MEDNKTTMTKETMKQNCPALMEPWRHEGGEKKKTEGGRERSKLVVFIVFHMTNHLY